MPTNTTNLNLLKMDPTADGSATFNIQTMLNDNWDKLDTAVAEKEGLLRDKAVKTAAADDDSIPIVEKSGEVKKTTYLQFKAMLKTFFDLKYSPLSHKSRHASGGADAITPSDIGALDPSGDGSNVTVTFTEAANYASPTSGDSIGAVVGKLAKLFTDLKTAAFRAATDFAAAVHRHVWGDIDDKPTTFPPSTHQHGTGDITSGTLPIVRGGTGGTTAAAARTNIGAAQKLSGTATLAVANWTGTAAPYTYTLAVSGMLATDVPTIDYVGGTDQAAAELIKTAWQLAAGSYTKPQTAAGQLIFKAKEKPVTNIPIYWEVMR